MTTKGLKREAAGQEPLTVPESLDRLFGMMAAWWVGRSLAAIARKHGISRQRVQVLLADVGCTEEVRRKARRDRPDSGRRALAFRVAQAHQVLQHPLARRLTPKQRGATAWQAQELVLTDIAKRMGITCQGVQSHLVGARWRLERLEAAAARKVAVPKLSCLPRPPDGVATEPPDIGTIDFTEVVEDLMTQTQQGLERKKHHEG